MISVWRTETGDKDKGTTLV